MSTPKKSHNAVHFPAQQHGRQLPRPGVVQPKSVVPQSKVRQPVAPPVYRPQSTPKVLQAKRAETQPPKIAQSERKALAPPAYRPQPVPKVLQTKMAGGQPLRADKPRQPVAPPVYRPESKFLQAKPAPNARAAGILSQPRTIQAKTAPHAQSAGNADKRIHQRLIPDKTSIQLTSALTAAQKSLVSRQKMGMASHDPRQPSPSGKVGHAQPPHIIQAKLSPTSPFARNTIQRMESQKGKEKEKEIPDDVLPFVSEAHRSSITQVDITDTSHKGTAAFQVTKFRNLSGICLMGLLPIYGGSEIGLSQNPSQKESLFQKSKTNSMGRVTVGTASVTVDNYKLKADDWYIKIGANLTILANSKDSFEIWTARNALLKMLWLEDERLKILLSVPLEELITSDNPKHKMPALLLCDAFRMLLQVNKLNEPCILRMRSKGSGLNITWSIDPDDPAGFQTFDSIPVTVIQLLVNNQWVNITSGNLSTMIQNVESLLNIEASALRIARYFMPGAFPKQRARSRSNNQGEIFDIPQHDDDVANLMGL